MANYSIDRLTQAASPPLTVEDHEDFTLTNSEPNEASESSSRDFSSEAQVLQQVVSLLSALSQDARQRILATVSTFFGLQVKTYAKEERYPVGVQPSFSADRSMSPKEFLLEKFPRSDVERVACLAYYLTHYRDQPHFKTLDISKINTEAAQPKFANAANSVDNAAKQGYLVASIKGQKQLSAAGEQFVQALPDRDAAKAALTSFRPRRVSRKRTSGGKKPGPN